MKGRTCDLVVKSCRIKTHAYWKYVHDTSASVLGGTNFLFSDAQLSRPSDSTAKCESAEIADLLGNSTLRAPSSVDLGWKNFAVERRTILPCEKPEAKLQHHFLILWDGRVAEGESAYRGGRFSPYRKYPNTITTCLPGNRPAARSRFEHEVIVGAIHPDFMVGIEVELDTRPSGALRQLYGTDAPDLRNLLRLLLKESETGGHCGTIYVESLIAALATRLLYAARSQNPRASSRSSPLPSRLLRRVLERMRADVSANLDLATLAAETGYSRAHFLRTFRAATGQTPHGYLIDLRLGKARALLASGAMPLIDIAAACGFSSHAHLTTAFRSRFGIAPSAYRRGV
jgi:AraC family transcriptional regulator